MVVTAHELLQSWDITDPANPGQLGEPVAAHTLSITSVGFSAVAHAMVTASEDGTVQLTKRNFSPARSVGSSRSGTGQGL
ncbi:hypothetical protein ACQP1O_04900 [Nocardia sp. CA-151230]|uniref:hypothetical protein n=1 Tax=Nocardia sp. CA-151230 TaxID=3239982 RepID=UPI003D8EF777